MLCTQVNVLERKSQKNFVKEICIHKFRDTPFRVSVYTVCYGTVLSDFEWRCSEKGTAAPLHYALAIEKKKRHD